MFSGLFQLLANRERKRQIKKGDKNETNKFIKMEAKIMSLQYLFNRYDLSSGPDFNCRRSNSLLLYLPSLSYSMCDNLVHLLPGENYISSDIIGYVHTTRLTGHFQRCKLHLHNMLNLFSFNVA